MEVTEALLPGMTEQKRFNLLRGLFAAGFFIGILMFFVPYVHITKDIIVARQDLWFSPRDIATRAMAQSEGQGVPMALLGFGWLLAEIALLIFAFVKPVRALFVTGAVLAVIGFVLAAAIGPQVQDEVTVTIHPLATLVDVLCSVAGMLGFIIKPLPSSGLQASLLEVNPRAVTHGDSPTVTGNSEGGGKSFCTTRTRLPGPTTVLWVGSAVVCLLLLGVGVADWNARQLPVAYTFRDSAIGRGRVLMLQNSGLYVVHDCSIHLRAKAGQTLGPLDIGDLAPGRTVELGWQELRDWTLEPGEIITLASEGYYSKRIVVP